MEYIESIAQSFAIIALWRFFCDDELSLIGLILALFVAAAIYFIVPEILTIAGVFAITIACAILVLSHFRE